MWAADTARTRPESTLNGSANKVNAALIPAREGRLGALVHSLHVARRLPSHRAIG
jgi:hypothetical protein